MDTKTEILVVDDNIDLTMLLQSGLKGKGYDVMVAHDGKTALAICQENRFDLALIDIKLPDMLGTELINKLTELSPKTEYIIITAYATMETAVEAVRHRKIVGYQTKPLDMNNILVLTRQVVKRKQAEQALRKSDEKYRDLVDLLPQTVFELDERGVFTFSNRVGLESMGYTQADLDKGLHAVETVIPEDRARIKKNMERQFRGEGLSAHEYTALRKDGSTFPFIIYSSPVIRDNKPVGLRGISIDVSERNQLQSRLLDAQKMEAISTLAGGIAHEFNNALTGITGNVELLNVNLPKEGGFNRYIDPMKSSAHRMVNLTNQLLAYARGGRYQPTTISLSDFIEDTLPILKTIIKPSIRVETDLPRDISGVKIDPTQVQMVLSAVLANASEAIEGEGRIRVNIMDEEIDEDFAKEHPDIEPGSYVCLTIEDDGKGMDEETRSKIFDPFFTTKFQGRGLGMAAVYGIIRNHDGWILIDSKLDKGTAVRIYFPVCEVKEEHVPEKQVEEPEIEIPLSQAR